MYETRKRLVETLNNAMENGIKVHYGKVYDDGTFDDINFIIDEINFYDDEFLVYELDTTSGRHQIRTDEICYEEDTYHIKGKGYILDIWIDHTGA